MDRNDAPLLGIHIGGLGFLAEVSKKNIDKSLQFIIDQKYRIEKRMRIEQNFFMSYSIS